jgi:hypothetical protein
MIAARDVLKPRRGVLQSIGGFDKPQRHVDRARSA